MNTTVHQGRTIEFRVEGEGEPIIFIHGWGSRADFFNLQTTAFRDRYQVIALDLHGHGASSTPEVLSNEYTIDAYADDVEGVLDQLGIPAAVVIGHSMGGLIAVEVAARGRASAVVLLDPAVMLNETLKAQLLGVVVPSVAADADGTFRSALVQQLIGDGSVAIREEIVQEMTRLRSDLSAAALAGTLSFRGVERLAAVDVPLLALLAQDPKDTGDELSAVNPRLRAVTLPTGHFVHLESHVEVNEHIAAFLDRGDR